MRTGKLSQQAPPLRQREAREARSRRRTNGGARMKSQQAEKPRSRGGQPLVGPGEDGPQVRITVTIGERL
jgi:hypothetical protein